MASKTPLPLWRIWARSPLFPQSVQILVSAATRVEAIEIVTLGVKVTRCVREVRS